MGGLWERTACRCHAGTWDWVGEERHTWKAFICLGFWKKGAGKGSCRTGNEKSGIAGRKRYFSRNQRRFAWTVVTGWWWDSFLTGRFAGVPAGSRESTETGGQISEAHEWTCSYGKEHGKAGGRLFRRSGADASRSGGYGICKVVSGKESKTAGKENCTSYALRLFGISGYFK